MKACFQIAECSLSSAKIMLNHEKTMENWKKSADSGAKSCFFRHFWHHYRQFSLFLCCFLLCVDVLWLCQYNQDKSWQCVYFFSSSVGLSMPFGWSVCARHTGIGRPCIGQLLPIVWAMSAQILGLFLGNIL